MHRRRGILRHMIGRLHDEALRRGEPIAALWASEGRIYQRFGYGLAATRLSIEMDAREVALRPEVTLVDDGRVRNAKPAEIDTFIKVYDQVLADRPGWSTRNEAWWNRAVVDIKESRQGGTPLRAAVHDGPNGVDGYMLWSVKGEWGATARRHGADP